MYPMNTCAALRTDYNQQDITEVHMLSDHSVSLFLQLLIFRVQGSGHLWKEAAGTGRDPDDGQILRSLPQAKAQRII